MRVSKVARVDRHLIVSCGEVNDANDDNQSYKGHQDPNGYLDGRRDTNVHDCVKPGRGEL